MTCEGAYDSRRTTRKTDTVGDAWTQKKNHGEFLPGLTDFIMYANDIIRNRC